MTQRIVDAAKVPTIEPGIQSLWQLYTFRRPEEVSQFIEVYPFLVPLLVEAHSRIRDYFGARPQVILEVVTDPEVQGLVEMFGYVVTSLAPEEAGKRLQQFDRGGS